MDDAEILKRATEEAKEIIMRAKYEKQFKEELTEKRFMFWTTYVWILLAPALLLFYMFYVNK